MINWRASHGGNLNSMLKNLNSNSSDFEFKYNECLSEATEIKDTIDTVNTDMDSLVNIIKKIIACLLRREGPADGSI